MKKNNQKVLGHKNRSSTEEIEAKRKKEINSINETSVELIEPALRKWIRIIKPSRSAITYERME